MQSRRTASLVTALGAVCAVLALAGCDLHSTPTAGSSASSTPTLAAPSTSAAPSRTATPSPTPTPTPTKKPSAPASSRPAAPTTSAAPTPPAPSTTTAPGSPTTTSYGGLTLTLPISDSAVTGAPAGFVAYGRSVLTADWKSLGGSSGCEQAPQLIVQRISSNGYALIGRNINPGLPHCTAAGDHPGGYQAILQETGGSWKQLMALQDAPSCKQMAKLGVPKSIYGECY